MTNEPLVVLLGNRAPVKHVRGGDGKRTRIAHPRLNQSVTRVEFWPGIDDPDMVAKAVSTDNDRDLIHRYAALSDEHKRFAVAVHEVEHLWPEHSLASKPAYVASSDPALQAASAAYFGCPEGEWVALITDGGLDDLIAQHLSTSTAPAQFNYLAISTNSGSGFAAADTTLASELTTDGLARAQATYAHTTGTDSATLTKTWTYTGATSTVIESMGTFNASSSGTLGEEDALDSSVTVSADGDTATVTYTATVSS